MTAFTGSSLEERRNELRQQLIDQRHLIAVQLEQSHVANHQYPRSMTMRFLSQRPALAAELLSGIATFWGGGKFFKMLSSTVAVMRIVRAAVSERQPVPPQQNTGDNANRR